MSGPPLPYRSDPELSSDAERRGRRRSGQRGSGAAAPHTHLLVVVNGFVSVPQQLIDIAQTSMGLCFSHPGGEREMNKGRKGGRRRKWKREGGREGGKEAGRQVGLHFYRLLVMLACSILWYLSILWYFAADQFRP